MKYLKLTVLTFGLLAITSGCIPHMIMNSMDHDHYSQYVQNSNQLNTEREKANLKPIPVMTFDQWKKGTPMDASTNQPPQTK